MKSTSINLLYQKLYKLTKLSALDSIISMLDEATFAMAFTSKGSNRAASSSFETIRAMLTPSEDPGGALIPPEKACPTTSFNLFDERDRYKDSMLDIDRKITIVSGLVTPKDKYYQ